MWSFDFTLRAIIKKISVRYFFSSTRKARLLLPISQTDSDVWFVSWEKSKNNSRSFFGKDPKDVFFRIRNRYRKRKEIVYETVQNFLTFLFFFRTPLLIFSAFMIFSYIALLFPKIKIIKCRHLFHCSTPSPVLFLCCELYRFFGLIGVCYRVYFLRCWI